MASPAAKGMEKKTRKSKDLSSSFFISGMLFVEKLFEMAGIRITPIDVTMGMVNLISFTDAVYKPTALSFDKNPNNTVSRTV